MQSKLNDLIEIYKELTKKQSLAIKENEIDKLNLLIKQKGELLKELQMVLSKIDVDNIDQDLKDRIISISKNEHDNISNLEANKKKLVNDHKEYATKNKALSEYKRYEKKD
jgi:hypothetical protein